MGKENTEHEVLLFYGKDKEKFQLCNLRVRIALIDKEPIGSITEKGVEIKSNKIALSLIV